MAKPTLLPRWANSGGAIVEPSSGKKDIGWVTGERAPAQYANWLQNNVYQWCQYVSDLDLSASLLRTHSPYGFTLLSGSAWTFPASGYILSPAGSSLIAIPIPVSPGERITALEVSVYGNGTTDTIFSLFYSTAGGADTVNNICGPATDTNRSAAWANVSLSSLATFTAHTFLAGEACWLEVSPNNSGYRLSNIKAVIERP